MQQNVSDLNYANSQTNEVVQQNIEEEAESRRKWQLRLKDADEEIKRVTARFLS